MRILLALLVDWQLPVGFDAGGAAGRVAAERDVWTDGSMSSLVFLHQVRGVGTCRTGHLWAHRRWGHMVGTGSFGLAVAIVLFLEPLQIVQRAEFCGVILAVQAADGIHLGDNLGVVRHVGLLLDGNVGSRPAELVKDCDLILLVGRRCFGLGVSTRFGLLRLRVTLDEGMVRDGEVRELDRLGDNAADEAAHFGTPEG